VSSWYLDLGLLAGYYGGERVYHHTAPISTVLALAEALRRVEEEGMVEREARHRAAAALLLEGLLQLGFAPLVEEEHRLPMLCAVRLPPAMTPADEVGLRRRLLQKYGIEVGGGLGSLAGRIWRIGLMGENARFANVEALLSALRRELG
jgi:alanine-glyoxylate transaminase/serine-glyoxylate transaminase/serine-pyruvate transaminase